MAPQHWSYRRFGVCIVLIVSRLAAFLATGRGGSSSAEDGPVHASAVSLAVQLSVMGEAQGAVGSWQELARSECFGLLAGARLGRIALVDDQGPAVFPVNFILDNYTVVFRTDAGSKLDAACRGSRVAFEIDGMDAATRSGWSVLVRGEAIEVTSPAEVRRLGDIAPVPWAPGAKVHVVRILPAVVTGRRISSLPGSVT